MKEFDVAVIGAGVVGGMIARSLSRYRLRVALIERANDVGMGASRANSAIVHAGFDCEPGTLKARLNVRGSEMMEETARQLGVPYRRCGAVVVGFTEEDRGTLLHLLEKGERNGVKGLRLLTGEQVREIEPHLSKDVTWALYAPSSAIICPYELTIAAVGSAMDNGTELFLNSPVEAMEREEDGYLLYAGSEVFRASWVVNCAGVFSDKIAEMAGAGGFSVTPRRGEYLLLDKEAGGEVGLTVFRTPTRMGKGILVTPTVDGNLLLGPTAEDTPDREDVSTTPAGLARILQNAEETVPGLPLGKGITSFCGLRSVPSTHDFVIGVPQPRFVNAAGIESPGLSSSPAIAEEVVRLLRESGLVLIEKPDFDPIRRPAHWFRSLSMEEKNEVIRRDPGYGRIVCRCEQVTEGEIRDALLRNPRPHDTDGVKRRTRSGMGRCQGGFCLPSVASLLAKELGIPFEEVTKAGQGSSLVVGRTKGGN